MRLNFATWRETVITQIRKNAIANPKCHSIGMERELLFNKALEELKKEKKIEDFIWHGWLSMADLRGIDFSVIVIDFAKGKRVVYPLSVTGHRWVAGHLEKHPKVTTIPVKMGEKIDVIKKDILRAIKNGNGHKQN